MSATGRDEVAALVPRGTLAHLDTYVAMLAAANGQQNLVSQSTMPYVWRRHILDAVQLASLVEPGEGHWIDVGSGAGLPGIVLALLLPARFTLVEPRTKRAMFLAQCVEALGLAERVVVRQSRIETVAPCAATVITARAVAALSRLFAMARHLADADTIWILPKGQTAAAEVENARSLWQGRIEMVPSRTDPRASIVVARDIRPRTDR